MSEYQSAFLDGMTAGALLCGATVMFFTHYFQRRIKS